MQSIYEIKFPIEQKVKEEVILKFATKQGGAYNIFSYYWQCFVWAATIGFLRKEQRPLASGTERIFTLNTIRNSGGEKAAEGLICMCIASAGTVDILKDPEKFIGTISEYANGGFYHIMQLMQTGENSFNDFEKVKQEIFSRNYGGDTPSPIITRFEVIESEEPVVDEVVENAPVKILEEAPQFRARSRWSIKEIQELKIYFTQGLTIEQLSGFFSRDENDIRSQLEKQGLI